MTLVYPKQVFYALNQYWTSGAYGLASLPAGVTLVSTPAPPFAGAEGETWMEFDGNSAAHQVAVVATSYLDSRYTTGSGYRMAFHAGWPFRTTATGPSADALIAADNTGGTRAELWEVTSTRQLKLVVGGVTVATSASALPTATNMWMDVWTIYRDSSGTLFGGTQFVVRIVTGFGGSLTETELINVFVSGYSPGVFGGQFGENNARGAGYKFYIGNVYSGAEDADNPNGIVRFDRLDPNGAGHLQQWVPQPAGTHYTTVDEVGTGVPDDTDYVNASGSSLTELEALTSCQYCNTTGGDVAFGVQLLCRYKIAAPGKAGVIAGGIVISDGSTDYELHTWPGTTSDAWAFIAVNALADAGGTRFTTASLNALEAGWRTDASNNVLTACSVLTSLVIYQKSGEGLSVLPAIPALAHAPYIVNQAVKRAAYY